MIKPKISVIIPMYNTEKYIRQCLISVLASKFRDYEVLVVNDCSTDNSLNEVEKLLTHFDGRLKILSMEKNSGGAGIPRNVGIKNAAGKYVTFIDSDDFILPTSLGEFFNVAENFNADVVHTFRCFLFRDEGGKIFNNTNLNLVNDPSKDFSTKPYLETKDFRERMKNYVNDKYFWLPWGKLYRRDFLLENKIEFPQIRFSDDMVFCFKCLCLAKNYLCVPFATNIYRVLENSTSRGFDRRTWLVTTTKLISLINEFISGLEFFKANPDVRCAVLKFFIDKHFSFMENAFKSFKAHELQKIFYDELQNPALNADGKNLIAAYLYSERFLTR